MKINETLILATKIQCNCCCFAIPRILVISAKKKLINTCLQAPSIILRVNDQLFRSVLERTNKEIYLENCKTLEIDRVYKSI